MKDEDDVVQSMKEIEQFTDHVGYGHRAIAWHTECATHLHFPAKNGSVSQCENYIGDGYGMDQSLKKDIEHFMDDPRRGARSFGEDSSYSDSNILFRA